MHKRTIIYLDTDLPEALRLKAIENSQPISALINQAVRESLAEDAEDILTYETLKTEPIISFEGMVKRLKQDGKL